MPTESVEDGMKELQEETARVSAMRSDKDSLSNGGVRKTRRANVTERVSDKRHKRDKMDRRGSMQYLQPDSKTSADAGKEAAER